MSIFNNKDEQEAKRGEDFEIPKDKPTETVVGPSVVIEGDFVSKDDMKVEGRVKGSVKTGKNVYIGEGAHIEAAVKAENAVVSGHISGNMQIKNKLELTPSAHVYGDIKAKILAVAPGAIFTGNCHMGDDTKDAGVVKKNGKDKAKAPAKEMADLLSNK